MFSMIFSTLIVLIIIANVSTARIKKIKIKSDVSTKYEQNDKLFEGDIMRPPGKARSLVMNGNNVRWANGIVPYEISTSYSTTDRTTIINAMRQLENSVAINNVRCVQFRPKVSSDQYYITIVNGSGCSSYIGQYTGLVLNRTVSLQTPGCIVSGIIMHELLHTLGFFHEQSRYDRDSYVKINSANIKPDMLSQFTKYDTVSSNTQGMAYDYSSVMHYQANAFSANGSPTIVPLQSNVKIGQRYFMSPIDIAAVRTFYSCSGVGTTLPPPTTTAVSNPSVITSLYSSTLTTADPTYTRPNGISGSNYYYESINVTISKAGTYTFQSNNELDTYVSVYQYNFDRYNPSVNLLLQTDDLSSINWNFKFALSFPFAVSITVVITTYKANAQGPFTLVVTGPGSVTLVRTSPTATSPPPTTTTTRPTTTTTRPTTTTTRPTTTTTRLTTTTTRPTTNTTRPTTTTTRPTTTTTKKPTTTTTALLILMDFDSNDTNNLSLNLHLGDQPSNYIYLVRQIIVSKSDYYSFRIISQFPAKVYLYSNSFNASNPLLNLITESQTDSNGQVQFSSFLQCKNQLTRRLIQKRTIQSYYLVVTTENQNVTGLLSISLSGPSKITINPNSSIITITNTDEHNNGKVNGIISGGVIGGIIFVVFVCALCITGIYIFSHKIYGKPLLSNKLYICCGYRRQKDIVDWIFNSGSFSGYYFKNGIWHGSDQYLLTLYSQTDYTLHGGGTDDKGIFVITGIFSPRTLRMAFDKKYQTGLNKAHIKSTVQVQWNSVTQNFQGKYYFKSKQRSEEGKYVMQIKDTNEIDF